MSFRLTEMSGATHYTSARIPSISIPQSAIAVMHPTFSPALHPSFETTELTPPRRSEKNAGQVQIKRFFFSVEKP